MNSQGGLHLSKKDLMTFRVIEDYRLGKLSRLEAALKLNVSLRTISRKAKSIRENGLSGLVHRNRGKIPSNGIDDSIKLWYLDLYKEKFYDFNFLHAFEYINQNFHPKEKISYTTFLRWGRKAGLGKKKKRRASKARIARERKANEGLMLQMDGSPHKWNGKDKWTLINMIDDATSKIVGGQFFPGETTFACMKLLRKIIEMHGIPEFILTDRAGWSARIGKRAHFSQFERACNELDITVISTSVPESKGRVERSFRTCQDRLTAEMRYNEIKTMTDANRYMEQVFIPAWNEKFSVQAEETTTRFRALAKQIDLSTIFCLKYQRQVNRDHTVHFEGKKYRIVNPPQRLWKHDVVVHLNEEGEVKLFYGAQELQIEPVKNLWKYKKYA